MESLKSMHFVLQEEMSQCIEEFIQDIINNPSIKIILVLTRESGDHSCNHKDALTHIRWYIRTYHLYYIFYFRQFAIYQISSQLASQYDRLAIVQLDDHSCSPVRYPALVPHARYLLPTHSQLLQKWTEKWFENLFVSTNNTALHNNGNGSIAMS